MGRRVLKFDGLSGRGLWWRLAPQFKVNVMRFAAGHCHSERQRRILVRGAYEAIGIKYRLAGRLPFGSQVSIAYHFDLPRRTPFATSWHSPQGDTRRYGIRFLPHRSFWAKRRILVRGAYEAIGIKYQLAGSSRLRRLAPIPLRGISPRESVSRDFQVAIAPLQITFACHPRPGGRINCPTLTCIFIWHYGLAAAGGIHTHRPAGRYLHPLNLLNPLHLLNPFL